MKPLSLLSYLYVQTHEPPNSLHIFNTYSIQININEIHLKTKYKHFHTMVVHIKQNIITLLLSKMKILTVLLLPLTGLVVRLQISVYYSNESTLLSIFDMF